MKIRFFIFGFLLLFKISDAQTVSGTVYGIINGDEKTLPGAGIKVSDHNEGTYTDSIGKFNLEIHHPEEIIISYIGFKSDTLNVNPGDEYKIVLTAVNNLGEVIIKSKRDEGYISKLQALKTEVITSGGLQKNACCSLAESFESNA